MARGISRLSCLVLLVALHAYVNAQLSCDRALELHEWALEQLGSCEDPVTQDTEICGLIGSYEQTQGGVIPSPRNVAVSASQPDQLDLISDSVQGVLPWQNFLVQGTMTQVADLGEVSYILNEVNANYENLGADNTTNEDYYAAWQQPWWEQADTIVTYASHPSNGLDDLGASQSFWKAANYYFTGFWPYPFSLDSLARAQDSVNAFQAGLDAHPYYSGFNFTTSFDNGSASADLPGILITPDASQALPLLIITGGTDFPKEMNVLQFGSAALERGYALLVYDGPGQGQVIRQPPYMPFFAAWDQVLAAILDYIELNFANYVDLRNIAQSGVSLGGYLGGRACSANSDRLVACLINPPQTSVVPVYGRFSSGVADSIYGPFQYVAEQNATLLPKGYAADFENYTAIIDSILLTCNASSGAPELLAEALSAGQADSPIDPELVYLAGGYGGAVTGDEGTLYQSVWQAFQNVQAFGDYDIGNISVPVIGFKGTEDDLLGGQEDDFFAQLRPEVLDNSTLLTFDAASGGALHNQIGSPYILSARTFAALNPIIKV